MAANPDVAAAGVDPLLHYLMDGWAQGRPLRRGPHVPLTLPASAVLSLSERFARACRVIRPRCRTLLAGAGPDPALTIAVRPPRGAMPSGWCRITSRSGDATLLVRSGGATFSVKIPAAPAPPTLVRLPEPPARLALQRQDRPGSTAAPRPVVTVCEIGPIRAKVARWRGVVEARLEDATTYAAWIRRYDTPSEADLCAMAARATRLEPAPRFSVLTPRDEAAATHAALAGQIYPHWDIAHDVASAREAFVVVLDVGTTLAPWALLLFAEAIAADPLADVLYGDEDQITNGERRTPWFKPDASSDPAGGGVFVGAVGVARRELLDALPPDWTATATRARRLVRIPHVLAHTVHPPVIARPRHPPPGIARNWPTVTAIVPTRDHAATLLVCLDGLLDGTDYPALDILVADNDSVETETAALLDRVRQRGVTVLACPGPFNYAAINNRAAAEARGQFLLFLNNDISVIGRDWLREMVQLAEDLHVGAVGAKLLYPDGTLQHGGVVLGMGGVAGHMHLGAAGDDPGYFGRLRRTQAVAAVTGACMLVPARHFAAVGGFDARHLAVAFNDIDLCLRLRRAGLRVVWTPHAVLHHWESKSRGSDLTPERLARFSAEIATMQTRWSDELASDLFHSPNLSLETTDPALAFPPRVPRPWE